MPVKKTPERLIDLDAKRIARQEAAGELVTVRLGGQDFTMPAELPVDFSELAQQGRIRDAITLLFNGQADDFFAKNPTVDDIKAMVEGAAELYGLKVGESTASGNS